MHPAIFIGLFIWSFVGFLVYMANAHHVTKPMKKLVFSLLCGPVGWVWGLVDWCTDN